MIIKTIINRMPFLSISCVVIATVSYISVIADSSEIWSPLSLFLVIPISVGLPIRYVVLIPVLAFIIVMIPFITRIHFEKVPFLLNVLIGTTAILAICWFAIGLKFGLQYQGYIYVLGTMLVNIAFASALIYLSRIHKKSPQWQSILLISMLETIWLFAYAFPYLGELP